MNNLAKISRLALQRAIYQNRYVLTRCISTTKAGDLSTVSTPEMTQSGAPKKKRQSHNWVSMGFDFYDQRQDIFHMHISSFFMVTVFFWGFAFLFTYYPDADDQDWIQREAYIELRRREVLGLPIVDKNYADPATIPLPPDHEIGDWDIII